MDVPFRDAQTGRIHLRLTAKTPVFVRQGSVLNATPSKDFVHRENVYFIPATSIKGMVRSVLEIISFGKLGQSDDNRGNFFAHAASSMDLAECIFGKVKGDSIKGRVQFSHAELKTPFNPTKEEEAYCGQPKSSYDPIYKENGLIKGWKRYPVRSLIGEIPEVAEDNEEFAQHFIPLATGSVFECDMRYFNLKREELGALIYALNFFEGAIYSIGFGKPYGFGQVTIELSGNDEMDRLKQEFIDVISSQITGYIDSVQLHELKEMMTLHPEKEHLLEYMSLAEYNEHREDGSTLPYYSELESVIIEEKQEQEPAQEVAPEQPPREPQRQEGELARVKSYLNGTLYAVLEEGKDKKTKPVEFSSFNPDHKNALKKLKKNPTGIIRVTISNKKDKLIFISL